MATNFRYRSSDGELAYYDDPPPAPRPQPQRWDRERFEAYRRQPEEREVFRFSEREGPQRREISVEERVRSPPRHFAPVAPPPPPAFYEQERYGRAPRRFFEEPTPAEIAQTALTPYRRKSIVEREREIEIPAPPRPGRPAYLRRQSSLDTFDRRPMRYQVDEWRPPANVPIPLPIRHRSISRRPYYRDPEDDFEEIRYRDLAPDGLDDKSIYEDIHIRRERTHNRRHRRRKSPESSKRSSSSSSFESISAPSESAKSDKTAKTSKTTKSSKTVKSAKEEEKTEIKIEEKTEVKLPGKKGKTRMPKRLVKKQAVEELKYPFDEDEDFIVITRALGKEQIDEIIKLSEKYKDDKVIYRYEEKVVDGPPAPPPPPPEVPAPPPPPPPPPVEEVHKTEIVLPSHHHRSPSPSVRSYSTHRSRSRHHSPARTEFIEERIVEHDGHVGGPLTVVVPQHRSDRDIRAEIRALEVERRALRLERDADERRLIAERIRDRDDYDFEIIERRDRDRDVVRVEKDRKGKRTNPKYVAAAMATLT